MKVPFSKKSGSAVKGRRAVAGEAKKGSNLWYVIIAGLMVISIVGSGWFMFLANNRSQNALQYLDSITTQKLLSQQIIPNAFDVANGVSGAVSSLEQQQQSFNNALTVLSIGDSQSGLPPLDSAYNEELAVIERRWSEYNESLNILTNEVRDIEAINFNINFMRGTFFNAVRAAIAQLNQAFLRRNQISRYHEANQILSRVSAAIDDLNKVSSADASGTSSGLQSYINNYIAFKESVDKLPSVSTDKGLQNATDRLKTMAKGGLDYSQTIMERAEKLVNVRLASGRVNGLAQNALQSAQVLEQAVQIGNANNRNFTIVGISLGAAGLVLMILFAWLLIKDARRREQESVSTNRNNQNSILRLLDEMSSLAEGDLTVHATVTEDITGAIADSVNFSIDALRNMVTTIDSTANEVSSSSQKTQQVVSRLREASTQQRDEISDTTSAITKMADTMESISESAKESTQVALRSVEIANKGAVTVTRNIDGMDAIREQIQGTSKRIKRLGESSQQIGEIVSLITDLADRTSILALNAAIQASSAGEAGRGFAVVADEVQRLAERAGDATKQISGLVETIQADTNEAVSSMEESTAGVVAGAKVAEEAGQALVEVEQVSQQLATLIQQMSSDASTQSDSAKHIAESMNIIQRITAETYEGTDKTTKSITDLTNLATELKKSVSGFKLPDSAEFESTILD